MAKDSVGICKDFVTTLVYDLHYIKWRCVYVVYKGVNVMKETCRQIAGTAFSMASVCLVLALATSSAQAADLIWNNGSGDFLWNQTSTNWSGTATWSNSVPDNAAIGDAGNVAPFTITLAEAITAGSVALNISNLGTDPDFTLAGGGNALTFSGSLTKAGAGFAEITAQLRGAGSVNPSTGTLKLNNLANDFSGGINLAGGTLEIENLGSLGGGGEIEIDAGTFALRNTMGITNTITLNGGVITITQPNRTVSLQGPLYVNGGSITSGLDNRYINVAGTVIGTAELEVGRGEVRIMSAADLSGYSGTIVMVRTGPSATDLLISDGRDLANNLRVPDNTDGARRLRLVSGSTSGEYSGDIYLQENTDGDFDVWGGVGQTITLSGVISEDANGPGVDIIGAGAVILTGTNTYKARTDVQAGTLLINGDNSAATGAVNVRTNATLGGTGLIGGNVIIYNGGIHAPGSDGCGVQSCLASVSYNAGAAVRWQLGTSSDANRGTEFDGIDVGGALSFDTAVALELEFSQAGSTVDWTDSFWRNDHQWLIWDVTGATTGFGALSVTVADWADANASLFDTVRPKSSFTLVESGGDIYLKYSAPPKGTLVQFL